MMMLKINIGGGILMIGDRDDDHHNDEADDGGIVAKGVKISTDQFFPQKN